MTRHDISEAILAELRAGALADLASWQDLGFASPLVEQHLAERIPPLRPWQARAGIEPLGDLKVEIRAEFARLFDQIR